jgi:hypothetical protein
LDLPGSIWIAQSSQMTVSNGTWHGIGVVINQGTLTITGGSTTLSAASVEIGFQGPGMVWVTGGLPSVPNGLTVAGDQDVGQIVVSNGTMQLNSLELGVPAGIGNLTTAGGTSSIYSNLLVGGPGCGFAGLGGLFVSGGNLYVTNASQSGERRAGPERRHTDGGHTRNNQSLCHLHADGRDTARRGRSRHILPGAIQHHRDQPRGK